jgi:glycerol-3-phosphate cytidylyltransferase
MNIITYWTFDLFHIGHLNLLKRCRRLAWDWKVIVWVSTDEFNFTKWKKSTIPFKDRFDILESIRYVDNVIPENDWKQKEKDIQEYNANLVMWDDWKWKFDDLWCIYIPRTPWISSTQIRRLDF